MGLFHSKKPEKRYTSNTTPAQMDLFEQMDRTVILVVRDDQPIVDGAIHACVTQAGYDKAAAALAREGPGRYGGYQTALGLAVDTVIQQESCRALVLYGLAGGQIDFVLTKEDLLPMRDVVDSFCILYAAARGAMPQEKAKTLMASKTVWLLGELPRTGTEGERFGFVTMEREGGYEAAKAFLTPESAQKFNREGRPVTPARVADLEHFLEGTFALILEPHRNYWLELGAESAKRGG